MLCVTSPQQPGTEKIRPVSFLINYFYLFDFVFSLRFHRLEDIRTRPVIMTRRNSDVVSLRELFPPLKSGDLLSLAAPGDFLSARHSKLRKAWAIAAAKQ